MQKQLSRRAVTKLAMMAPLALWLGKPSVASAQDGPLDLEAIFATPGTPVFGPADANLTMVGFLDYNCPFCKQSAPYLKELMATDDKLRVVFKDWPILTEASVYGGQAALAAHENGQYLAAHDALMAIPGRGITEQGMREALEASDVDMVKVDATIAAKGPALLDQLRANTKIADEIGLTGTPSYLVGPFFVGSALDLAGFREVVAAARQELGV
ncbi:MULTISPECIES: DsbA family protein [Devosia]|uniref:Protein-disulfide isomerase n=3 Tax=Devosia TaxID=46913 RepID=A0A1M5EN51_9HYPH|nr:MULTISPECIES: DsbA family protein [Devosia]MBU1334332.1 DsbA family protein [Alphaproteobacteria bacterium]KFL29729.1 hypothetical protein JP75_19190 [Devosia riboflavina]MBU1559676.1 DsbA family protein [Alphaproteobacteria bacterium]MBU2305055.1 DsbA family protein [Alphaproteobacteria bacterium]MBU2367860.1 DsbA family protein [Alphaproteobacteria bacterium]